MKRSDFKFALTLVDVFSGNQLQLSVIRLFVAMGRGWWSDED